LSGFICGPPKKKIWPIFIYYTSALIGYPKTKRRRRYWILFFSKKLAKGVATMDRQEIHIILEYIQCELTILRYLTKGNENVEKIEKTITALDHDIARLTNELVKN
jgi:hypothetical protein